ncbi:hypothetical protein IL306_010230 [Fusarium sp. DS 682]|nr:hypothetical protein IL306_010230 [Fusarium sp. DS 682]
MPIVRMSESQLQRIRNGIAARTVEAEVPVAQLVDEDTFEVRGMKVLVSESEIPSLAALCPRPTRDSEARMDDHITPTPPPVPPLTAAQVAVEMEVPGHEGAVVAARDAYDAARESATRLHSKFKREADAARLAWTEHENAANQVQNIPYTLYDAATMFQPVVTTASRAQATTHAAVESAKQVRNAHSAAAQRAKNHEKAIAAVTAIAIQLNDIAGARARKEDELSARAASYDHEKEESAFATLHDNLKDKLERASREVQAYTVSLARAVALAYNSQNVENPELGIKRKKMRKRDKWARALNHRPFSLLETTAMQQHANPIDLSKGTPQFPLIGAGQAGLDLANAKTFTITKRDHHTIKATFNLNGNVQTQRLKVESRLVFRYDQQSTVAISLQTKFEHYTVNGDKPNLLYVRVPEVLPVDSNAAWYPWVANSLANVAVEIKVDLSDKRTGDTKFQHRDPKVNGLTALVLILRSYGTLHELVHAFSFAPAKVAKDIRTYKLAHALGTQPTRYLLGCIFEKLASDNYEPDQPHLIATAVHLIVAHMKRDDQHAFLQSGEVGQNMLAIRRMVDLVNIAHNDDDPYKKFPSYAKMAALRDGILYGSMRAYAQDLDAHNESHVRVLNGFAAALTKVASAAAGMAPIAGAPAAAAVEAASGVAC